MEFATAVEEAVRDVNVVVERTASNITADMQLRADSIVNADVNTSGGYCTK